MLLLANLQPIGCLLSLVSDSILIFVIYVLGTDSLVSIMKVSLISVDVSHRSQVFTMIYFDMGSYNKLHVKATNKHYRSWHFAVKADSCFWLIDIDANALLRLITCMYTCVPKQLNY